MVQFRTTRWVAALVAAGAGCTLAADGTVLNRLTNSTAGEIHVHPVPGAGAALATLRVRTGNDQVFRELPQGGIGVPARGWIEFEIDPLAGPKTMPDYHLAQVPFRIVSADRQRWEHCQFNGHGVWNVARKAYDLYGFLVATMHIDDQAIFSSIVPQAGAAKGNFEFIGFAPLPAGLAPIPRMETKVPAVLPAHAPASQAPVPPPPQSPAAPPAAAGTDTPTAPPAGAGQASSDPSTQPSAGGAAGTSGRAPSAASGAAFGPFSPTAVPFVNLCRATIELRFPDDLAEVQGDRNARMTPDGTRLTGNAGLVWAKDRVRLNHKAALTFSFDFGHCGRFLVAGSHSLRFRAVSVGGTHTAEFQYSARCVAGSGGRDREFHADIRDLPRAERRSGPAPAWPALPGASSAFLFTPLETMVFTAP
jgi:hypothetical protein